MVTEDAGTSLTRFMQEPWEMRARLAQQVISLVLDFQASHYLYL